MHRFLAKLFFWTTGGENVARLERQILVFVAKYYLFFVHLLGPTWVLFVSSSSLHLLLGFTNHFFFFFLVDMCTVKISSTARGSLRTRKKKRRIIFTVVFGHVV